MPGKRLVLEQLKRDELLDAVDVYELDVPDRRVRDFLVDALALSRRPGSTTSWPTCRATA